MPPQLTPEQHAAVYTHDRNLIVVAGAGSGKTYVLVQRFIALLQATDWPLKALVAITFTRKAAGEMRARVRTALEQHYRAAHDETDRARWAALMAEMDSARINTIHGLCAEILRANAAEARLDPDFEVLEDVDAALLLEQAIDDALNAAAETENHPALRLFGEYPVATLRATLTESLPAPEPLPMIPADLLAYWQAAYADDLRAYLTAYAETFTLPYDLRQVMESAPADDKLRALVEPMVTLTTRLSDTHEHAERLALLRQMAELKKASSTGSAKVWGDTLGDVKAWLAKAIEAAKGFDSIYGDPTSDFDARAAVLIPAWVALVSDAQARYTTLKESANGLDFDDLESRTAALLRDYPSVRARYTDEIRHLMVDEFQDTNQRQWEIVRLLAGDRHGALFVVGDPKQSIYAFRGADVSVFDDTRAAILAQGGQAVNLTQTFRTHRALVETFNTFFVATLQRQPSSVAYRYQVGFDAPMQSDRDAPCPQLAVELITIERDNLPERGGVDPREWEAYALAARLRDMVAEGRPVFDRRQNVLRPVRYGDVALLLRAMTHVNTYENALRALGVPFVTVAGRGYYGRQEVRDLLNLLQALYTPSDDLALAAALRSPLFGLSDDALYALRLPREHGAPVLPLWDALHAAESHPLLLVEEIERVRFAARTLSGLRQRSGRVSIAELLRAALHETGFLAALSALPDGDQRRGNVEKLMQKALIGGRVSLPDFVAYLRDMSAREVHEGDAALDAGDAVQLMTIHKSKGLEFPVVALAETSSTPSRMDRAAFSLEGLACKVIDENGESKNETQSYAWRRLKHVTAAREDAEQRRLLYVAMTRAADVLLVTAALSRKKDGELSIPSGSFYALIHHGELELTAGVKATTPQKPPTRRDLLPPRVPKAHPDDSAEFVPPLLREISITRDSQARYLSASHLEDLGAGDVVPEQRAYFYGRFRRQVLYDAPDEVKRLTQSETHKVLYRSRQIGEVVHRALQFWQLPNERYPKWNGHLRRLLVGYAWDVGLTISAKSRTIDNALKMLWRFRASPLYAEIMQAAAVYRELPFVYEHDGFIVRGVIDVLYRTPSGEWVVVDYKTSRVKSKLYNEPSDAELVAHAQRYHLQVGVYASAVYKRLGVYPRARIHYVQYNNPTVEVSEAAWRAALDRTLSERVRAVILGE